MLNRDIKFMQFAKRLAIDNYGVRNRFKLAALLVYKRDVISIGLNTMRTHPMQKKYSRNDESIYLHAEVNCIINALNHLNKNDLHKSTMYIARVKKPKPRSAEWIDGNAHPCEGCCSAIEAFGIHRIVYTTDFNNKYEEVFGM
jgi:deoxycytidylate deaminase